MSHANGRSFSGDVGCRWRLIYDAMRGWIITKSRETVDLQLGFSPLERRIPLNLWISCARVKRRIFDGNLANYQGFECLYCRYRREGLLANRQEGKNIPQKVFGYGIASVFTPTEHRKKGYARHMMRLLHWILAPKLKLPVGTFPPEWGAPPERPGHIFEAAFSVLYSDVGADFYAQCGPYGESNGGWILTEPTATTWSLPIIFENETLLAAKEIGQLAWKWLDGSSTNEIWDADAKLFADEMKTAATGKPIEVTFLPQKGVAGFQYHRLQYFWEKLEPIPKFWSICAQSGSGEDAVDPTTFASWTLDIRPPDENALIITRLRARPEHFLELLAQILEYARQYKVDRVEVWGLPRELRELATSTGGKTFARDDHLSSFKSYLKEKPEDIAWIHNEKFCWC